MWREVHPEYEGDWDLWVIFKMSQCLCIYRPRWPVLEGQMSMMIQFYFYHFNVCFEYMGSIQNFFPAFWQWCLGVQPDGRKNGGTMLAFHRGSCLNKQRDGGQDKALLSKSEVAEGCQHVLQSHSWLDCSHTWREEWVPLLHPSHCNIRWIKSSSKDFFPAWLFCITGFLPTGSVTCKDGQGATYLPSPPLFSPNQFAERTDKNSSEYLLINSEIKIKVGKGPLPASSSVSSGFLNSPKTLLWLFKYVNELIPVSSGISK